MNKSNAMKMRRQPLKTKAFHSCSKSKTRSRKPTSNPVTSVPMVKLFVRRLFCMFLLAAVTGVPDNDGCVLWTVDRR